MRMIDANQIYSRFPHLPNYPEVLLRVNLIKCRTWPFTQERINFLDPVVPASKDPASFIGIHAITMLVNFLEIGLFYRQQLGRALVSCLSLASLMAHVAELIVLDQLFYRWLLTADWALTVPGNL